MASQHFVEIVAAAEPRSDLRVAPGTGFGSRLTTDPTSHIGPFDPLDSEERKVNYVRLMFSYEEGIMLKIFVEEAAALASISLFVGMVAVWAELIPQL
jgi:hypothetical protein